MHSHFPLVFTLFFAFAVLADPRHENRWSRFLRHRDLATEFGPNWAGAAVDKEKGNITSVTATFKIPIPSGPSGSVASAWVGLDGHTCYGGGLLQTGVDFSIDDNGLPAYYAWAEWFPALDESIGLAVSGGDVVRANVTALSATSGIATIENLSTGQNATKELNSTYELCRRDAEWIVEDFPNSYEQSNILDNFGTFTFRNAKATGPRGTFTPQDAVFIDIEQNNEVLTSVSLDGHDLVIEYI